MTRTSIYALGLLLLFLVSAGFSMGQVTTGTPAFGSFGGGAFDTVNLENLNVHFAIPFRHRAGRGMPFTYDLSYDSSVWYSTPVNGVITWQPVSNFGWRGQTEVAVGYVTHVTHKGAKCPPGDGGFNWTYDTYVFHDMFGVPHPFVGTASADCNSNFFGFTSPPSADGSGYSINVANDTLAVTITSASGDTKAPPQNFPTGAGTATDANGNQITVNANGVFTDTLGTSALSITGGAPNPLKFSYTGPNSSQPYYQVNYTTYQVKTNFGCSGIAEDTASVSLVSSISLPDGSSYRFAYEPTPGFSGYVTGRLGQITLPTGGTIGYSYNYTDGHNGIICSDGSTDGLTRTVTPGGQWTYARTEVSGAQWQTKITSPPDAQNQNSTGDDTVINFQGLYQTQLQQYQGPSSSGTLLQTVVTCYNSNLTSCTTTAVTLPIARRTITLQLPGGRQSKNDTYYNSYGSVTRVDNYDFGNGAPGSLLLETLTSYASLGNGIANAPSQITVHDGANNLKAQTTFAYDEYGLQTPPGGTTPSQISVSGSRGNLTTVTSYVSGSSTLTKHFWYYNTGNLYQAQDANGALTTYNYPSSTSSCGNSFPTSVTLPLSLTRSFAWGDCIGGLQTQLTDENSQPFTTTYSDPLWRPTAIADPLTNTTNFSYASATQSEGSLNISGSSTVDVVSTLDQLGRPQYIQQKQAPAASNYDSVQYSYDNVGRPYQVTAPYVATLTSPQAPGGTPVTTTVYDALGRGTQTTDGGGGTTATSYSPGGQINNDVLITVGPAPLFQKQLEYDGLGRLASVCEVTSGTGNGTCGQTTHQTGYWTTYTYDSTTVGSTIYNRMTVYQNAQSGSPQSRTYLYDLLGRLASETNPETGVTTYLYDSDSTCGTSKGDLVERVDAMNNVTCYAYDQLHRVTDTTYPSGPSTTAAKHFVYDGATVNGVQMQNAKNRLAEAYTGSSTSKITDIGFNYSARGEVTELWESTPNSGGYYHPTTAYWANGALNNLWMSGLPSISYGADGEGRTSTVSATSGQNPVTGTSYNTASQVTGVTFGSGDSDALTFDPNTGRMTQYKFNVNGSAQIGNLQWNANGTLSTLGITDPFNAGNAQNCSYGYDPLGRIQSVGCGSVWAQTFVYDPFGNATKSGSSSWQPGYNAKNQYQSIPGFPNPGPTYDANGDTLTDSFHTYTWDAEGHATAIDSTGLTYDALGRMVEQNQSGTYFQIVYSPLGKKLAVMKGQTIQQAFVPLPGGTTAEYLSWGLSHYRHPDWLGSSRLESSTSHAILQDTAYAPFGEPYAELSGGNGELSFTGQNKDTDWLNYDFMYREYDPRQGRWISPDPSGLAAVDPTNPQTWNRYAYVGNSPCNGVDPLGLDTCTFDIQINNKAKLTDSQLAVLEGRINAVFGSAQWNGNSVQALFSFTGKPDFQLNISPNTNSRIDGYSGWPASSPTIYWGNISTYPSATIFGGTAAAHEIVHRGAGPVFDLWGSYNGTPNLMNVNQAQGAGLGEQVSADWSNPNGATGFASLSPNQVQKLYTKCSKNHPGGRGGGGGGGKAGGSDPGFGQGWNPFDVLDISFGLWGSGGGGHGEYFVTNIIF